jgi:leucyl aminopeptidase
MAAESALVAEAGGLKIRVREERELKKEGFGGILAVGESSRARGPRFIELTYAPRGSAKWPHVVLIGKGIVFDTGGISLKRPYDIMIPMKSDMAGVAGIIGTMSTLHVIKPKIRVTALLACAENTISGTAQRPSDVITHFGGTTVEVKDTDAEGRLVLADSLAYAGEVLNPDVVINMATLTSAATLGLGRQFAALYSNDDALALELEEAGSASGDRAWRMPLIDDYRDSLKSEIADFSNISSGGLGAGSIMAALFLQNFVGDYRWAHLDIAGAGRSEVDAGENIKGGTGYGVRILCEWLAKQ